MAIRIVHILVELVTVLVISVAKIITDDKSEKCVIYILIIIISSEWSVSVCQYTRLRDIHADRSEINMNIFIFWKGVVLKYRQSKICFLINMVI